MLTTIFKRFLLLLAAILAVAIAFLLWVATTETGLRFALQQAEPMVTTENVAGRLNDLQLRGVKINLESTQVQISQIDFAWNPLSLLSKTLLIDKLAVDDVEVRLEPAPEEANSEPWAGIEIPIHIVLEQLRVQALVITSATGDEFEINELAADLKIIDSELEVEYLKVKSPLGNLDLAGKVGLRSRANDILQVQVNAQAPLETQQLLVNLDGSVDGTWGKFSVTSEVLARTKAPEQNTVSEPLLDVKQDELNDSETQARLKLTGSISGALTESPAMVMDGRWSLPFGLLQSAEDLATSAYGALSSTGNFKFSGVPTDYRFDLTGVTSNQEAALLNVIASGQGSLDSVKLEKLQVQRTPENEPPITNFDGTVELAWSDGIRWQAEGELLDLEPELLLGDGLSGLEDLSGQLTSRGEVSESANNPLGVVGNVSVTDITANWQGSPLTAGLQLDILEQDIQLKKLFVNSASFALLAEGVIGDESALTWSINAEKLQNVMLGLGGKLNADGLVSGPITSPTIEFDLSGSQLTFLPQGAPASEGWVVSSLRAKAKMSQLNKNSPFNLSVEVGRIDQGDQLAAATVSLELAGSTNNHTLTLASQLPEQASVSAVVRGGLIPPSEATQSQSYSWSGEIQDVVIVSQQLAEWALQSPAKLVLSSELIKLDATCIAAAEQSLCAEAIISQAKSTQTVSVDLSDFDLTIFDPFLRLQDIKLAGRLDGKLNYAVNGSEATPKIAADITGKTLRIGLPETLNDEDLEGADVQPSGEPQLDSGSKAFSTIDGREWLEFETAAVNILQTESLQAVVNLKLDDGHFLTGKVNSQEPLLVSNFSEVPITGRLELKWADLSMLPAELLGVTQLNGRLDAVFDVEGSVSEPQVSMRSELSGATLFLPATGVLYSDISATAISQSASVIDLQGRMLMGEGELTFAGGLDFSKLENPAAKLKLKGQGLSLLQTSDMDVMGGLDLVLSFADKIAELSGDIVIEEADLQLGASENVILASDDVVVQGAEVEATQAKQRLRLTIDLGNSTKLNVAGLSAELQGKLGISQDPGELMIGQGQIEVVNGIYQAYGEELTISKGQLLFNGSSVDNPRLDLEATREVDDVVAGVRVQGTAQSPRLSLFANPTMSDQDVLSMLIFGKRLSSLGGEDSLTLLKIAASLRGSGPDRFSRMTGQLQDALGLSELELRLAGDSPELIAGKQLSSRFYIGYGYGLLDATQSLVLRFKISKAWSVQGDFGVNSGADLRYQIER